MMTIRATYTDAANDTPAYIYVLIDFVNRSMVKEFPADNDYTDGVVYMNVSGTYPRGFHNYNITTNDGVNPDVQSATQQFLISNRVPSFTSDPVLTALVNQTYIYDVNANDGDGDILSYNLTTNAPGTLSIDPASGLITGIVNMTGSYSMNVTVIDGFGGIIYQNWTLTVSAPYIPPENPWAALGVGLAGSLCTLLILMLILALLGRRKRGKKKGEREDEIL